MKKLRIPLFLLVVLLILAGGLFVSYRSSLSDPPALFVNGVQTIYAGCSWRGVEADGHPAFMEYGEENIVSASMGDEIRLCNRLPWLGLRERVQITLYEMDTGNCYASWPLSSYPKITKGYADPGSYCMGIYVVYRGLFIYGSASYGAILIVE